MRKLFVLLIMIITSIVSFAQSNSYILTNETTVSVMTPYLRLFKDSIGNTPFSVISDTLNAGKLKAVVGKRLGFLPTKDVYWLKFELANHSGSWDWIVDIDNPIVSSIALYVVNQAGVTDTVMHGGLDFLKQNKFGDYTSSPFLLHIKPGSSKKLFFRIQRDAFLPLVIRVMSTESFVKKSVMNHSWLGLFWGIIMTSLIINIIIYFRAGHGHYRLNVILLIAFSLIMFYQFGFGFDPLPGLSHGLKHQIRLTLIGIIFLSFNIRITQFFNSRTDEFWRVIFQGISIILILFTLSSLSNFFPAYILSLIIPFIIVAVAFLWFCISVIGLRKFDRRSLFFFLSMLPFVIASITAVLFRNNFIDFNFFTSHIHIFAITFFCSILTLESIEELTELRKEKAKAVELASINQLLKHEIEMREKAQKTLVESEEKYRNLIENIHEIIFKIDSENNLVFVSPSVYAQFGYTPEELVGKPFTLYIKGEEQQINESFDDPKAKHLGSSEYELITKSGEIKHILSSTKAIFENGVYAGGAGTIIDMTDRKLMELKLRESEKYLKETNATKDKFFSIISHDLLDPFNALLGFSSLLTESAKKGDVALNLRYADIINQSVRRILDLLQNLLLWTKVHNGKLEPNLMIISISELVTDSLALLLMHAQYKQISIQFDIEENAKAAMDYNMMATVIRNLVGNAIKYSNIGGTIIIESNHQNNMLHFSVTDHGTGIDEEHLDELFMLDKSHRKKGTSEEAGTGLGLFISKEFIDIHRGQISVESTPDKGSRFMFSIPAGLG